MRPRCAPGLLIREDWWALEVSGDDLPYSAFTQVRRLDQAEAMVRDLLALHFEIAESEVGQIEIVPVLDAALAEVMDQTRNDRPRCNARGSRRTWQSFSVPRASIRAQPLEGSQDPACRGLDYLAVARNFR
jgi:hypothetical protein